MRIERYCKVNASRERGRACPIAASLMLIAGLAGCAAPPRESPAGSSAISAQAPAASPAPAQRATPASPAHPFEEAVVSAADALFSSAASSVSGGPRVLVVDPLIDEATAYRSAATRSMQAQIVRLARTKYTQFDVQELTRESIAQKPLVLLGSLAGVTKEGGSAGTPAVYRIWLVLADLQSGRIVAKSTARATPGGVDLTPATFERDSPGWTSDPYLGGYLRTCGGKAGDPIDPVYLEGIETAALVREATDAYEAARYQEALDLYSRASQTAAGDQLRVHNGLYLANWQLGRREEAARAFAGLVDYGLRNDRLAIRFLFKPATATFWPPEQAQPYPMWLEQLASRTASSSACLEVTGHTSPTGPTALNERLSLRRAEYVAHRLEEEAPQLAGRMIANGAGARENIVGTGTDDVTDALDRRVEFKALPCSGEAGTAASRADPLSSLAG
jgi:outer membrane protein OmpA-like peptidoglycan-associated protein